MARRTAAGTLALAICLGGGALALTSACTPVEGRVVGRDLTPAHTEHWLQPIYITTCEPVGKTQECTQRLSGYVPESEYVATTYRLQVADRHDHGHVHDVDVDHDTYRHPPAY